MKYSFSVLLALLCCLTAGAYDFIAGDIAYNLNGDGVSVTVTYTKYGNNYPGVTRLTIPQSLIRVRIAHVALYSHFGEH